MKEFQERYTVILASNRSGNTHRIHLSTSWLKASAFLAFVFVALMLTAIVDYSGLIPKAREHTVLVGENENLKERTRAMERRLSLVTVELERVHNLTTKLKVIGKLGTEITSGAPSSAEEQVAEGEEGVERAPAATSPLRLESGREVLNSVKKTLSEMFATGAAAENLSLPERIEMTLQDSRLREQELMNTWGNLSDRQNMLSAMPSIKPAHGYYSSPFGYRFDPINGRPLLHAGVDIAAPWGTQVLAPGDGVVSYVGYEGGYGNLVAIDHGYGVTTRFAHNSRIFVHQGQRVRRWEPISAVGSTGHSTGAHVHYEVRVHGLPVDPVNYILQDN